MQEVSVIIPNFNGMAYLDGVLAGLECQSVNNFEVILVDNGSSDGSCAFVAARYPWVHLIELPENFGFCKAVNEGIKASRAPYVLLLNNDIEVTGVQTCALPISLPLKDTRRLSHVQPE